MVNNLYDGLRVLDFTSNIAGPTLGALLADYGAEVIKIEKPVFGDDTRAWGKAKGIGGDPVGGFMSYNRGKKSLVVDLKDPEGIDIIKSLVTTADILLESNRPGVMDRLGLGYKTLHEVNPRLVYASISCFGQEGLYSQRPGYDVIAQAACGIMDMTGDEDGSPTKIGTEVGDFCGGLGGWGAVNAALYFRERTGSGQHIDIALTRILTWMAHRDDESVTRSGNLHATLSPYGMFQRTKDEYVIIATANQTMWRRVCETIGRPELFDDPKFASNIMRCKNTKELAGIIEDWMRALPSMDAVCEALSAGGVPFSKVYNQKDIRRDPHYIQCGWLVDLPMSDKAVAETGKATKQIIGSPVKFSGVQPDYRKAPSLGANNFEVLSSLGYSKERVNEMENAWAEKVLKNIRK